jgi:hypothetical protein
MMRKSNHKDKFAYKKGDLKYIDKSIKEHSILSFSQFLIEKNVKFDDATMRWITIHDENNKQQHILIKKKDGTIIAGMGGEHNGEKIDSIFNDAEEKKSVEDFRKNAYFGIKAHEFCKLDTLNEDEESLFKAYSADMYADMNDCLRECKSQPNDDDFQGTGISVREFVEWSDIMSKAIRRNKTTEPIILYRGIDKTYFEGVENEFKVGGKLYDYGFASSSTKKSVGEEYSSNGYVLEIHAPKGSRASSIKDISFFDYEEEVLIDKNACFTIKEIDTNKKVLVVELSHDE